MGASIPQLLVNGVALGAAYALIALGFVLVINAVGAVNFAQGDLVMAGGFIAVIITEYLTPWVSENFPDLAFIGPRSSAVGLGLVILPLTMVVMAVLGLLFSALAYAPLRHRSPVSVFISTIAVGLILQHGANAVFGPEPRVGPPLVVGGSFALGPIRLSIQQLSVILAAGCLIAGTGLLLSRSQLGRHLRAVAQDPEMAEAIGISAGRCIAITFALAVALAGSAGMLLSNQFFVAPSDGGLFMLKAYIAVTLGGWGRLDGAAFAALLIGIFEVMMAAFVSYVMAEALLYVGVLLVLLVRPSGLLRETIQRRT
jgi:branched-chain amino acid transport system permease protein